MIPLPAGYEGLIELDEGDFVLRDREAGRPWRRTLGTYVIDEESNNVIASITFNNGVPVNRVMVIRYELDGADRASGRPTTTTWERPLSTRWSESQTDPLPVKAGSRRWFKRPSRPRGPRPVPELFGSPSPACQVGIRACGGCA